MSLLYRYSRQYWKLVVIALLLAATNQIFSLLDPVIFRHVIDGYATKYNQYTQAQFIHGAGLLLLAAVGVAFVSRVAKNFQDYFVNVIVQRLGARMYSDGIQHSLDLPYQVFEDQRSGETLGKLQKVRSDVERFVTAMVNVLFTSFIGIVFVMIYAFRVHWSIAPAFFVTVPLLGIISSVLSRKIKKIQKTIVSETTALAGSTTESLRNIELVKSLGLAHQEVQRLNAVTDKILKLELKESEVSAQPQFHTRDIRQRAPHQYSVLNALLDLSPADHGRAVLFTNDLFVLHIYSFAGVGKRHQHLS